jgi:hypothetical protein
MAAPTLIRTFADRSTPGGGGTVCRDGVRIFRLSLTHFEVHTVFLSIFGRVFRKGPSARPPSYFTKYGQEGLDHLVK